METKVQIKMEHLNSLSPMTFVEDPKICEHFINVYRSTHNVDSDDVANDFYSRESLYFKQLVSTVKDLKECTMFSLYGCFMDIIVNGLTFDPSAKLLHVEARSFNTAAYNQTAVWEKRARNVVDAFGELALRIMSKQIKYVDDPVIVYEGDTWEPGYAEAGNRYCIYKAKIPRSGGKKIIGSFMKITRNDGSFDMPWFTEENFNEWKAASKKANKEKPANELYTSGEGDQINIGFLKTKTIKHSFKTYPKVKVIGGNTELEEPEFPAPTVAAEPKAEVKTDVKNNTTAAEKITAPPHEQSQQSEEFSHTSSSKNNGTVKIEDEDF